jgi:hypothetical protein
MDGKIEYLNTDLDLTLSQIAGIAYNRRRDNIRVSTPDKSMHIIAIAKQIF